MRTPALTILLLLSLTLKGHAKSVNFLENSFEIAEGKEMMGTFTINSTTTLLDCIMSCISTIGCHAVNVISNHRNKDITCQLITESCKPRHLINNINSTTYFRYLGEAHKDVDSWCIPFGWTTKYPTLYYNLENLDDVGVHGALHVSTPNGMGLSFSEHNQSWADLGNLSTATCITRPWTCERGSTISMMIKTDVSCLALDGLLSTYGDSSEQGLLIMCRQNPNGVGATYYHSGWSRKIDRKSDYVPGEWVRLTVVGEPQAGEMRIYLDGVGGGETGTPNLHTAENNGHVVLGRRFVSNTGNYATFVMDDLIIWDEALPDNLIQMIL